MAAAVLLHRPLPLQKHALQVAAAMEHFGRMAGEDPEIWWAAGLLHDLDYEKYPEEHMPA